VTPLISTVWFASVLGLFYSLLSEQWIGAFTMLMNLITTTIMLVERIEK
jgi:hypothetical protein